MARVTQAYQHLLTVDCYLQFLGSVTRRVALRNVELFIGQLIPFTALIQLFFFNDQDSRLYHTILVISLFAFT